MRELLEKWAELEPDRCRLNLNWKPANGDNNYYIAIQTDDSEGWQLVYSDAELNCYFPDKNEALGRIQWAVQSAIISQGQRYNLECYPTTGICEGLVFFSSGLIRRPGRNPAEALLAAYLGALEVSR